MTEPPVQTDFYKTNHAPMYPDNTTKISSNLTPRKSRMKGVNHVVVFGLQYFIIEYVIRQWNENFFGNEEQRKNKIFKNLIISSYKRMMDCTLGKDSVSTKYMEELWDLGYMPLKIKALPEGTICPIGIPCLTITNTHPSAFWLVNYLETILSCTVWQPMTSATIAYEYRKLLDKYAMQTNKAAIDFVQFQGHDFSMRGMSSLESACTSGAGHLTSFSGTDTVPAIQFLMDYYGANIERELVGTSVPATEHSVMCMGLKDGEQATFERLLRLFPKGILSVVSDTWDLWKVCTDYLPKMKDQILARDGKLVIRPDSGDPVKIITGWRDDELVTAMGVDRRPIGYTCNTTGRVIEDPERKGVIELLWDTFGGTVSDEGYKVLDSHIGAIYGDSITLERAKAICERLKAKGFASTNIVFGIGSYTYQYNTRDTFGFAMKATYGEVLEDVYQDDLDMHEIETPVQKAVGREIFKAPITDSGEKKSAKGLLRVEKVAVPGGGTTLKLIQQCTPEMEEGGELKTVFLNGKLVKMQTLSEIRDRLKASIKVEELEAVN